MTRMDIARCRLFNQRIAGTAFDKPGEVVEWLGAVQAQDYLGALWAVGLRARGATEADIERALADRTIVRTWPMRGTLHFVTAADVRWMLKLLTPRIITGSARRLKQQFDLDDATFARSKEVFARALQGGKQLTRDALYQALEAAQISTAGQRGLHILWRVAQEGLICFGAREGKQHTFALLDEWAPNAKSMERDEALAELARRYFTSHGPATLQDFVWWSGLRTADAQAGLDMVKAHFVREVVDDRTYWFPQHMPAATDTSPTAYLLPSYDEYMVGYKDRSAALDPKQANYASSGYGIFNPIIIIDGRATGTWKRAFKKGTVVITPHLFNALTNDERRAVATAAARYGAFLELPVAATQA